MTRARVRRRLRRIRSRSVRFSAAVAAVAALALLVPACIAQPPDRNSEWSAQVWRSDGYGWIYSLRGGRLEIYETTEISCIVGERLDQIGQPGPDGTVQFGRSGVASQTVRPGNQGSAILHLIGTAADVDLLPIPALPDACSRRTPDDPLTTFDIFWTTFAEHYNAFPRRNIDWVAVRDKYRPMVDNDTDPDQLFEILRQMIEPLGDAHTGIDGSERSVVLRIATGDP